MNRNGHGNNMNENNNNNNNSNNHSHSQSTSVRHNLPLLASTFLCGGLVVYTLMSRYHAQQQRSPLSLLSSQQRKPAQTGKKPVRVYVDGCWDVCHSGHYNAIRQAKALGDILVVGVHSDREITFNKREPIMNNKERMAAVSACKWVDEVEFDAPYSPTLELLDRLNCDFCAHGDDMPMDASGHSAYEEVMHRLRIFRRTPGVSTTHLIERLLTAVRTSKHDTEIQIVEEQMVDANENNNSNGNGNGNDEDEDEVDAGIQVKSHRHQTPEPIYEKPTENEKVSMTSWSSFLASSSRISAFSNQRIPSKSDVVVYIDGVFDLFHIGHIAALKAARSLGTFLFVGLYDDSVVRQRKGDHFPLMGIQERVLNVLSCKYVDEVLIGAPWKIKEETIKSLNIAYVVLTPNTLFAKHEMDRYSVAKEKGILRELQTESEFTTHVLMDRIKEYHHKIEAQNQNRVAKARKYVEDQSDYIRET